MRIWVRKPCGGQSRRQTNVGRRGLPYSTLFAILFLVSTYAKNDSLET
jgi:hypothetical protein